MDKGVFVVIKNIVALLFVTVASRNYDAITYLLQKGIDSNAIDKSLSKKNPNLRTLFALDKYENK